MNAADAAAGVKANRALYGLCAWGWGSTTYFAVGSPRAEVRPLPRTRQNPFVSRYHKREQNKHYAGELSERGYQSMAPHADPLSKPSWARDHPDSTHLCC